MLPVGYLPCTQDPPAGRNMARVLDEIIAEAQAAEANGWIGVTSLDDALDRANAYAEAGADLLFLPYLRVRDTKKAVDALPKPLFNVVNNTPREELESTGLKVAVYPVQSLFVAYKAVRDMIKELNATGTIANLAQRTPSFEEFNEFIGAREATQRAEKYHLV